MFTTVEDYHYDKLISHGKDQVLLLNKYKEINAFLIKHDWLFVSPFFFLGSELNIISELSSLSENSKEKISKLIADRFFNLPYTASFIDGYCARCTNIKPFLFSIEHSLVLTFQRDYEGAIKTLIPIIEGIIRKYLKDEKGLDTKSIGFKKIKDSFDMMCQDLILDYSMYIKNYTTENKEVVLFTEEQLKSLIEQEKQYNDMWFSFVSDFVNKSLYLNTNGKAIINEINRHSILHEFGDKIEYSFENYIKIYFLLQFLTWVFLKKERKSLLNGIENLRFYEKVTAYKEIIKLSEKLIYEKHLLYKNYEGYDENALRKKYPVLKI